MTHNDPPVPLITLPNWIKAAAICGFRLQPLLEELGIPADLAQVETASASSRDMERLMSACVARSHRRHFPLVLGETFAFQYLPEVETFLATSGNLRESARIFDWLQVLLNPYLRLRLYENGEQALLRLDPPDGQINQSFQWFVEGTFVSVVRFGRTLLGDRGDFVRVAYQYPEPDYSDEVRAVMRLPVSYLQAHNELRLPRHLLDLPLQGAFESLHQQAEQQVTQRVSSRTAPLRTSDRLRQLIEAEPVLLGKGIAHAAGRLNLHPRTLQRRLAEEQVGYAEIQDAVRVVLARRWLQDHTLDVETISDRLGFSDRRSFTRAFVRWTGLTPSSFRRG